MPEAQSGSRPRAEPAPYPLACAEYRCPGCAAPLEPTESELHCSGCKRRFPVVDGIVDFRYSGYDYYFNPVPSDAMAEIIRNMSPSTWVESVRAFLRGMQRFNPDWLDNLIADGRYSWKYLLDLDRNSRLLDLGCGLGNLSSNLAPNVGKVYALDLTMRRLEFSRERFKIFNRDDDIALVAAGDGRHLPFPDSSLDCVVLSGVLEWIGEGDTSSFRRGSKKRRLLSMLAAHFGRTSPRAIQLAFLREIRRVLKPEGQLFIAIENRFNYEYFTGRPDHHSRLKYGSLLPRFIATLYSIARHRMPYRTYTYGLHGYRGLLAEAGFPSAEFWGLSRGYSHLNEIIPLERRLPGFVPFVEQSLKRRLKRHPLFVPAYGIIAGAGEHTRRRLQDDVLAAVEDALPAPSARRIEINRYLVTGKDKLIAFATRGTQELVLKLPCNRIAIAAETCNADMLEVVNELAVEGVPAPGPLARGQVGAVHYFVEERLPGNTLRRVMKPANRTAFTDRVAELLDALSIRASVHSEVRSLDGDLYATEVGTPLRSVLAETQDPNVRRDLEAYFRDQLYGRELAVGLAHGDLTVSNILARGDTLSGLIDWEAGRTVGACVLDTLSYLVSVHHLFNPQDRVNITIPALAAGQLAHPAEERLLADRYQALGVDPRRHEALVYLCWLRMAHQLLGSGLRYNPVGVESFVTEVVRHVLSR